MAALPAAILGALLNDYIDEMLESPLTVAVTLVLGGILLLFVDKWFQKDTVNDERDITIKQAFVIGCYQCLALIPGMSRSASTIVGGMTQSLTRKVAAEFSFFLAIPMMLGASGLKLIKYFKAGNSFTSDELNIMIIGNVVGFIVAIIAIKTFINILTKYGFKVFGIYRIIVGLIIITILGLGYNLSVI